MVKGELFSSKRPSVQYVEKACKLTLAHDTAFAEGQLLAGEITLAEFAKEATGMERSSFDVKAATAYRLCKGIIINFII